MDTHCRLCGSKDAILYNLFAPNEDYLHYVKKIHKLLPIVISEFDPLPKVICHRCAFKISEFYDFRINCIRTQENLKTKLPWIKSNKENTKKNSDHPPMVELKLNPIQHFSPAEKRNLDDNLIVIEDDEDGDNDGDDDDNDDNDNDNDNDYFICADGVNEAATETCQPSKDEMNMFQVENTDNNNRIIMKIRKNLPTKRSSIWDAKNFKNFGKRRRRKKKSCKIDQIFSTSSSVYQNMGESDIIDPTEYISAQENSNRAMDIRSCNGLLNTSSEDQSSFNSRDSDSERILPNFILITKIPSVGNAYTCKKCRRTFLVAESAASHDCDDVQHSKRPSTERENVSLTTSNNDSEDVYICDICNKIFPRQVTLLAHKKQHFVTKYSSDSEPSEPESVKTKRPYKKHYKVKNVRQKINHLEKERFEQNDNIEKMHQQM